MKVSDLLYLKRFYGARGKSLLKSLVGKEYPGYKRVLAARDNGQELVLPQDVLSSDRIDVAAKTIFARAQLRHSNSSWPEEIYKEHLRAWNNFFEDEPLKETFSDFRDGFKRVIDSYANGQMNHEKSPVIVNKETGVLRNGAHRVAAALVTGETINIVRKQSSTRRSWGVDFFRCRAEEKPEYCLAEKYINAMTIEYISIIPKGVFAAIIFPAAKGKRAAARKHLESLGRIINHRSFKYNELNSRSVIRQLYYGEEWNYEGSQGVDDKAGWCFNGTGDLQVFLIESHLTHEQRIQEKEYLREFWGIGKNSIHMTDTYDEVNMVARMFFHDPTIDATLRRYNKFSAATQKLFDTYRNALPGNATERDMFCIDSSAVMDFYDIRQAADLDYISMSSSHEIVAEGIDRHQGMYVDYYPLPVDEMILHPDNHFYYAGCKILSLKMVEGMKERRASCDPESAEKDERDLKLIRRFRDHNPAIV